MAETDRDDLTEQDRGAMTPAGPTTDHPEAAPATAADREDAREPAGTAAPLVPDADNPQVPAGTNPPGGPAESTGDVLADRRAAEDEPRTPQ